MADRGRGRPSLLTPEELTRRRELVFEFKYQQGMSYGQIVDELKKHGFTVDKQTIGADVERIRKDWADRLRPEKFDARGFVAGELVKYEFAFQDLIGTIRNGVGTAKRRKALKPTERARLWEVALRASERAISLLQDVGLIDRRLGELVIDPLKAAKERLPSAPEIRAMIDQANIEIIDAEFMSAAEKEQRYGLPAGSESTGDDASNTPDGKTDAQGDRGTRNRQPAKKGTAAA